MPKIMKYTITINQRAAIESFGDTALNIVDFALIEFIGYFASLDSTRKTNEQGRVWFWLKWTVVRDQMPLLGLNTHKTVWGRLCKLCDAGFLQAHSENQTSGQAFYSLGKNWEIYNSRITNTVVDRSPKNLLPKSNTLLPVGNTPYYQSVIPPLTEREDNKNKIDKYINDKEEQVFAHAENLQPPPTDTETQPQNAYTMGQAFAEAMRLEMQTRADGLASYQNSIYRSAADTFLEKCVLNIAAAAQTCYRHENAKINLTPKVAQAYGSLLFNRFEMLCENGNGTNRNLHTQTAFQQTLMQLSQYCEAFICDVLSEATMGGWETPKTDAAILADKYNKWLYTHKQTENLTKVREKVESADKAAKNAFSVAIGVLEDKEIDMVNKAAKASKINKRSVAADLKAATRRAYAAVMYMRTKDAIYNSSVDANGVPMGMEAEHKGDAVYTAAYEIIKGNYQNW
jgi:hypothetical protein